MGTYRKDWRHVGLVADGFGDWQSGRAYWDGHNYRVKHEDIVQAAGVPTVVRSSRGPIAPWNRAVKHEFADVHEFHVWATK